MKSEEEGIYEFMDMPDPGPDENADPHFTIDGKEISPDGGKLIAKLRPCDPPTTGFWYSPFELVEEYVD